MKRVLAALLTLLLAVPLWVNAEEDITLIKRASRKAVTAPEQGNAHRYRVKTGDTLRKILIKNYGVKPEDIPFYDR